MRNLKKVLALALASVMLMGMMVVGTSAYGDVASTDNVEAIAVLEALGVMEGDDKGNFNPDQKVTREQMAVIMCALLDLDTDDYKGAHPFTDVPAWADDFVSAAYANGIVSGVAADKFGTGSYIKAVDAGLMMMKALGWFAFPADFEGDYKLATVKKASEISLYDGIEAGAETFLTRNEIAQLALNALESKVVTGTNNSANTNISLGDAVIEITGKSTYAENNALTVNQQEVDYNGAADGKLQLIEKLYGDDYTKDTTSQAAIDAYGRPAAVWTDTTTGDVIVTAAETAKYVLVGTENDTLANLIEDNKLDKVIDLTAQTSVIDGTETVDAGFVYELFMSKKVCTAIVAYEYDVMVIEKVEKVDADLHEDEIEAGAKYVINFYNDNTDYFDIQMEGFDAKTFVKDAVIIVPAVNGNAIVDAYAVQVDDNYVPYIKGMTAAAPVTVKVDTVKAGEFVTAGTAKYPLALQPTQLGNDALAAGAEFKLYIDANGYVVAFEEVTEAAAIIDDVYYVDFVDTKTSGYTNQQDTAYYAQLVAMDGTISTIELEAKDKAAYAANGTLTTYDQTISQGDLVTISDKKWSYVNNNATTTLKADDGKYDLAVWAPNADWDKDAVADFTGYTFDKDSTRLSNYRVTADTKYILITKTGANLGAEVKVGGIDLTGSSALSGYVLTEYNKSVAKYVIIASAADINEDASFSTDLIYIKSAGTEAGDGYKMQTVYFADGTKKDVKMDAAEYTGQGLLAGNSVAGFYKYDINKDGYYTLQDCTDVLTPAQANNGVWKDEAGIIEGASVSGTALYEGLLTVTYGQNQTLADIKVADAKFVDAHSTTTEYTKAITSLANLVDLMDKNVLASNTIQLNVAKDGAVVIILTSATVPQQNP